jgi:hypothetical protein
MSALPGSSGEAGRRGRSKPSLPSKPGAGACPAHPEAYAVELEAPSGSKKRGPAAVQGVEVEGRGAAALDELGEGDGLADDVEVIPLCLCIEAHPKSAPMTTATNQEITPKTREIQGNPGQSTPAIVALQGDDKDVQRHVE